MVTDWLDELIEGIPHGSNLDGIWIGEHDYSNLCDEVCAVVLKYKGFQMIVTDELGTGEIYAVKIEE